MTRRVAQSSVAYRVHSDTFVRMSTAVLPWLISATLLASCSKSAVSVPPPPGLEAPAAPADATSGSLGEESASGAAEALGAEPLEDGAASIGLGEAKVEGHLDAPSAIAIEDASEELGSPASGAASPGTPDGLPAAALSAAAEKVAAAEIDAELGTTPENAIDIILAGGGGSLKKGDRGGRGASGSGDRMSTMGGVRSDGSAPPKMGFGSAGAPARAGKVVRPEGTAPGARIAPAPSSLARSVPAASGLKAGSSDDNRQFNLFVDFLAKHRSAAHHYALPVAERIVLRAEDSAGRPLSGATVEILAGKTVATSGLTYADGSFLFFPLDAAVQADRYVARVRHGQKEMNADIDRRGTRAVTLRFPGARRPYQRVPVDIVFVFDATGSMSEEIDRLKSAIELLHLNLSEMPGRPLVRFGMVVYRDRGDAFVTRTIPLTEDLDAFASALRTVKADGGGDTPEDLQTALDSAVRGMAWNSDGIRMGFVVTDAEAHLDYGQAFTYVEAAREAKRRAIKFFSVGTGGLGISGEYQLRQIAQYTAGRYIFLTYGERGDSEGGRPGAVSHHTGDNFQTDKLEAIILRCAREEIAHLSDHPIEERDDYFLAQAVEHEPRDASLQELYRQALAQLSDYSSMRISDSTPTAILPLVPVVDSLRPSAEYFSEQLVLAGSRWGRVRLVERGNVNQVLTEQAMGLSGLVDPAHAAEVGKMLGAKCLVSGSLHRRAGDYEVFLRLLRVETGEVLSATRARIDAKLGL